MDAGQAYFLVLAEQRASATRTGGARDRRAAERRAAAPKARHSWLGQRLRRIRDDLDIDGR